MDVEQQLAKHNNNSKTSKEKNFNKNFNDDPTTKHSDIVISNIKSFKKTELLSTSSAKKLTTIVVRTSQFQYLTKNK